MSLQLAKKQARKLIKARLHEAAPDSIREQSQIIARTLDTIPEYRAATRVAYYLHMENHEIETEEIIAAAFRDNKRVFLPRIVDINESKALFPGHRKELEMIEVAAGELATLKPFGPYKLREPALGGTTAVEAGGLDAIIVPGLGFTKTCHRLGHGKGFYDTYIAKHIAWGAAQGRPAPFLIGIGATEQFIDMIPTEGHDYVLDAVVAGDGTVYTKQ